MDWDFTASMRRLFEADHTILLSRSKLKPTSIISKFLGAIILFAHGISFEVVVIAQMCRSNYSVFLRSRHNDQSHAIVMTPLQQLATAAYTRVKELRGSKR